VVFVNFVVCFFQKSLFGDGTMARKTATHRKDEPSRPLDGYEVLLCVTGGIACYKSADLASKFMQDGAGVTVAMTAAAEKFVAPLTFQALSMRNVYTSLWMSPEDYSSRHISLTELADIMIIAPTTANVIGKMANGIADDLISSLALSATGACPILIAPAMNTRMWSAPVMQHNLQKLKDWGVNVVGPGFGRLACGTIGEGRMIEPEDIRRAATEILLRQPPKKRAVNRNR